MNGYFWFTRSSLQGLHIAVYHTISYLLASANKKEKTDHNLTSHNNSPLRRRLFGSVTEGIVCVNRQKKKKKKPALKDVSNLSNLIKSEYCRVGWTISLCLNTKLFTQSSTQANR